MQQAHLMLHGHRMAYRVAGDPGLPVLLLVHGITSSSATWEPIMPALAEHAQIQRACWVLVSEPELDQMYIPTIRRSLRSSSEGGVVLCGNTGQLPSSRAAHDELGGNDDVDRRPSGELIEQ